MDIGAHTQFSGLSTKLFADCINVAIQQETNQRVSCFGRNGFDTNATNENIASG